MVILTTDGAPWLFVFGGGAVGIPDQATAQALIGAGVKTAAVTASFYAGVQQQANASASTGPPRPITWTPSGTITLTPSS